MSNLPSSLKPNLTFIFPKPDIGFFLVFCFRSLGNGISIFCPIFCQAQNLLMAKEKALPFFTKNTLDSVYILWYILSTKR